MPRRLRISAGDVLYHVINRRVARLPLFEKDADYRAFESVLHEAVQRFGTRLLSYTLMPNHWHLVLWPRRPGELSRFMQWLTVTHMRRWHAHRDSAGTGPIYQGRFKSFPVQDDRHLRVVCRYVERNPLRAGLVKDAGQWPWGSLARRGTVDWLLDQGDWPVQVPPHWEAWVNQPETAAELDALRRSVNRGQPFGDEPWQRQTARRLKLASSLRNPWRPKGSRNRKKRPGKTGDR